MEYWDERKGLVSRLTVLLLKIQHQKINLRFSCRMYWRVSCKIVAKNQNHQIIGGSNPNASFQVQERGCHVVCFLCSLGMSSSLLVKTTVKNTIFIVLWKPHQWVQEGLFVLHEKENRHEKHATVLYQDKELLVIIGHMPWEIAEMCCFFTKHDGEV